MTTMAAIQSLVVLLVSVSSIKAGTGRASPSGKGYIYVDNAASGGEEGLTQYCIPGTYAYAFRIMFDSTPGNGDKTGMNAVRLQCRGSGSITSLVGDRGSWSSWVECPPNTYLSRFSLKVEGSQGRRDDTTINNIRFACSVRGDSDSSGTSDSGSSGSSDSSSSSEDDYDWLEGLDGGNKGDYGDSAVCSGGKSICGLKTFVDGPYDRSKDNSGMNDVMFECC